jgi:hypothetical protein
MKRIIAIVAILATFCTGAQAQYTGFTMVNVRPSGTTVANDTTSNTDTSYLYFATGGVSGTKEIKYNNDLLIKWTNTQLSGTSGGTVILQGSPTGTFTNTTGDWQTLINDKTQSVTLTDTVTVSGTTSGTFIIRSCPYRYIRARYISSGTQTSTLTGTAWVRPRQ